MLPSIVTITMMVLTGGSLSVRPVGASATNVRRRAITPPPFADFFVATNGSDSYSGTLAAPNSGKTDGPFQSLDRARRAVASLRASEPARTGPVIVMVRGGGYALRATFELASGDSGTAQSTTIYENYPGEAPVLSGGLRVTSWTNAGGNLWKATLPPQTAAFENLFYNGVRRLRPRFGGLLGAFYRIANTVFLTGPNAPPPPAAAPDANCAVYVGGSGWECFDRFQYDATDPISSTWKNLAPAAGNPCGQPAGNPALSGDIEVLDFEQFSTSKLRISCVDSANRIVYMTGPTGFRRIWWQWGLSG
ncbi:MAG TPA: hypothetical protein VLC46_10280 [Thermoanaerobaculia bacterium]|nr:hypothetical protein [Thermoanaerobaculia bacterium]